jgi:alkylation response protein AidB-like acyl-CoA dehydrogenase
MTHTTDVLLADRMARAAEVVAPLAARHERDGRLSPEAVAALAAAGVFKLLTPRAYGGEEASLPAMIASLDRLAQADGATGWCAMVGATSSLMGAYLPDDLARAVYEPEGAVSCGVFAPTGKAVRTPEGLRVTGRWSFASGCQHSPWRMVGVIVSGDAGPVAKCVLLRDDESRVVDNWDVMGLRGTGSHDLAADDVLVPEARCFSLVGAPRHGGESYRVPVFGVLAMGVAAVAVGIAQGALDRFIALAREKVPMGARRALAHRERVQWAVADAEARVRSARALLHEAAREVTEAVRARGEATLDARATLRLAACHAARGAASAVDLLCETAGAGSIRATEPLQRMFRDVHVATQHAMVSDAVAVLAGRVRLGIETEATTL